MRLLPKIQAETHHLKKRGQAHSDLNSSSHFFALVEDYEFLLHHIRVGVWRIDAHGRIVEINRALCLWLGVGPYDLIGVNASRLFEGKWSKEDILFEGIKPAVLRAEGKPKRQYIVISKIDRNSSGQICSALQVIREDKRHSAREAALIDDINTSALLANSDPLTGLGNRRAYDTVFEALVECGSKFGIVSLDLDGFKPLNDELGHAEGDKALQMVASVLTETTGSDAVNFRLGGDEFAVLVETENETELAAFAKRIQEAVIFRWPQPDGPHVVSASVGWAHVDEHGSSIAQIADEMMYRDKEARRSA